MKPKALDTAARFGGIDSRPRDFPDSIVVADAHTVTAGAIGVGCVRRVVIRLLADIDVSVQSFYGRRQVGSAASDRLDLEP